MRAAISMFIALTVVPMPAEATIGSVTVNTTKAFEHASEYTYAEITIHGSVVRADGSVGQYRVPAVIIYPQHGRGKGVGVVDRLNSAFYHFFPPATEFATFQFTLLATANYLFEQGYTYISVQWDKAVIEIFGPTAPTDGQPHNHLVYGSIDRSADAWESLLDAARLLKDPRAYPGPDAPAAVATVLSSGYSQGAAAQLEVIAEGLDATMVYDGHLIQMIGFACWKREDVAPHFGFFGPCSRFPRPGIVLWGLIRSIRSCFISGTFTRFGDDEFLARYASRHDYVKRIKRAADDLAARRYITHEDATRLIAAAQDEALPLGDLAQSNKQCAESEATTCPQSTPATSG